MNIAFKHLYESLKQIPGWIRWLRNKKHLVSIPIFVLYSAWQKNPLSSCWDFVSWELSSVKDFQLFLFSSQNHLSRSRSKTFFYLKKYIVRNPFSFLYLKKFQQSYLAPFFVLPKRGKTAMAKKLGFFGKIKYFRTCLLYYMYIFDKQAQQV